MNVKLPVISDPFGKKVDVLLLAFLVLIMDVKLAVKIPALILVYSFQWNVSFGFRLKNSRLPLFYPFILLLTVVSWLLIKGAQDAHYNLVLMAALASWAACLCACHQVRLFTDRVDPGIIHRTIYWFFLLNLLFSLGDLVKIIWETKALNPYLYQGNYQKYFIRTGDYIKGISFDTSTTNALINAFGVFYFLYRKQAWMLVGCMTCLLMTGSNFTNICLLLMFALVFIFRADREQKGAIILCVCMGIIFLGKVSPQNNHYTEETFARWWNKTSSSARIVAAVPPNRDSVYARHWLDSAAAPQISTQTGATARPAAVSQTAAPAQTAARADKPEIPVPDINTAPYQNRADTSDNQRILLSYISQHQDELPLASLPDLPNGGHTPGKWLALSETRTYYQQHPWKVWTGLGAGNYSSKLAFRATGLDIAGGYPQRWIYINTDFQRGALDLYLAYFSRPKDQHSLTNSPDSVYGQMWGEYGLIGLLLFLITYLGFFARRLDIRTYGAPIFLLMVMAFAVDYWFEQLSVVVLFELLMFTDQKTMPS